LNLHKYEKEKSASGIKITVGTISVRYPLNSCQAGMEVIMKKNKLKNRIANYIYLSVLLSFIIPVIFLIYRIVTVQSLQTNSEAYRSQADYVLMLVQCILGIVVMLLPNILAKKFKFEIPSNIYFIFVIFLYCAIFLGEVRNFYYTVPHWDTILHTFGGFMWGAFGFSVIAFLNKDEHVTLNLTPIFVSIFAFCFSVALGTLWEIYEFSFDGLLGLNMQKFALEGGTLLVGRAALADTMKDLIVDGIGSLIISVFGYFSLKHERSWIRNMMSLPKQESIKEKEEITEDGLKEVSIHR
jgi:hypothetical protein